MRPGPLFWGTALLGVGILLLLDRLGLFVPVSLPVRWWPMMLILLGGALVVPRGLFRNVLVVAAAIVLCLVASRLIFGGSARHGHEERPVRYQRLFDRMNGTRGEALAVRQARSTDNLFPPSNPREVDVV